MGGDLKNDLTGNLTGDFINNSIGDSVGDSIGDSIDDSIGGSIGGSIDGSTDDSIGDSIDDLTGDLMELLFDKRLSSFSESIVPQSKLCSISRSLLTGESLFFSIEESLLKLKIYNVSIFNIFEK